jgi:hypothetical protein
MTGLFANATDLSRAPNFLAALLDARGVPAPVYRSLAPPRRIVAAGLLQATSLSFLVVVGQLGVQTHLLRPQASAALIAAGLISVLLFPVTALTLLSGPGQASEDPLEPAGKPDSEGSPKPAA